MHSVFDYIFVVSIVVAVYAYLMMRIEERRARRSN